MTETGRDQPPGTYLMTLPRTSLAVQITMYMLREVDIWGLVISPIPSGEHIKLRVDEIVLGVYYYSSDHVATTFIFIFIIFSLRS